MTWTEDGKQWLTQGEKARNAGNLDEAQKCFFQVIRHFPDKPDGYNKMGVVFAQRKELDQAQKYFEQALACDSQYVPALTNLGNIFLEQGEWQKAQDYYQMALALDSDYSPAHRNLAVALRRQGSIGLSVRSLKQSIRLERRQAKERRKVGMQDKSGQSVQKNKQKNLWALRKILRWIIWIVVGVLAIELVKQWGHH
ncbi:MAG: tetratricopeptide repeat protein [Firmicutes bacterium]|nr:tetratricopeptide repeat protein [Bacillota bacterium]